MDTAIIFHRAAGRNVRIAGLVAGALALAGTLAAAAAPPAAHKTITKYNGAKITNLPGQLFSISAVSQKDAWSVGFSGGAMPLMLHWNGTTWTRTALPGKGSPTLNGVSADSASDAWAVGGVEVGGSITSLALHWNGTAWVKVAAPSPGKVDGLNAVSALSPSDAWAVGFRGPGDTPALVLHWNGTSWSQVPIPRAAQDALYAVKALSPTNVWAFGQSASLRTRILHWNGTAWTKVTVPVGYGILRSASALSPRDIWAVGSTGPDEGQTLVLHWNGTAWTRQPSPSPAGQGTARFSNLLGVSALSDTNAWAVGSYGHLTARGEVARTLVLHWNGTAWTQAASPSVTSASTLNDVQALSPTDAWAVGRTVPHAHIGDTVILHWNGTSWTPA